MVPSANIAYKQHILPPNSVADSVAGTTSPSQEGLSLRLNEVKTLIGRALRMNPSMQPVNPSAHKLSGFLDSDIERDIAHESNPSLIISEEYAELQKVLTQQMGDPALQQGYEEYRNDVRGAYAKLLRLMKAYEKGSLKMQGKQVSLSDEDRVIIARQIIRLLELFVDILRHEIQNVHNHVSQSGEGYRQSDTALLEDYVTSLSDANKKIQELIQGNYEVAIQKRLDQILDDAAILKRKPRAAQRRKIITGGQSAYIETTSRAKLIYGDESSDNYILSVLRAGQNVEFHGPTGTGKTKIAVQAARVFSGKDPIIVSGGPGVYRSTFFGSPKGLDTRDPGAVIKCIEEDRVLIVDEDNRIDPANIAEIKLILGLRPGDAFIHPDTGDTYTIPPHFRVMVTRNEKGKHHTDRYDLPPDYRREFVHGSFEVGHYTPAEMYERFLIPKLTNPDGSLSLSVNEIGGNVSKSEYSPLLSLVLASEKIQEAYKDTKLKNAVFESGFMIDILNQWQEVRFKKKGDTQKSISFLEFLETKLLEFIKRPIGNQDRKIIAEILYNHGFFFGKAREVFSTAGDGDVFTDEEYKKLTQAKKQIFKSPTAATMSAREVALLDPFGIRKITIPRHPLEADVVALQKVYGDFCVKHGVRPMSFTATTLEKQKDAFLVHIESALQKAKVNNVGTILAILKTKSATAEKSGGIQAGLKEFLKLLAEMLKKY